MKQLASIALIIPSLRCGGAERIVGWLANSWVEEGRRVLLITLDGAALPPFFPLDERVERHTIRCTSFIEALDGIRKLRRVMREHSVAGAITFVGGANVFVPLALYGTGIPVVTAVRDHPVYQRLPWLVRLLRPLAWRLSTKIVVQSDQFHPLFPRCLRARLVTIPNPVPAGQAAPQPSGPRRILCGAGRLVRKKGFADLIAEFSVLAPEFPEWDLIIYGAGMERDRLEHLVAQRGLKGRVELPGEVPDLPARLRGVDLFVLPSLYEGFPNALCEAMAAERAVVARDCPGAIRDIIVSGVSGVVFSGRISVALRPLMMDGALRERLGREAGEVVRRFAPELVLPRWEGLVSSLAISQRPPR